MNTPKSLYRLLRLPLAIILISIISFFMFKNGNSQEEFELGRMKYREAEQEFDRAEYASTIAILEEALALGFEPGKGLMGETYLRLHDYKPAKHYLKDALNVERAERFVDDYYAWVNYNLGMVYYLERNGNIAYKYFKISHDLGYPPAAKYASLLENKEGRLPKL